VMNVTQHRKENLAEEIFKASDKGSIDSNA
jgi:hypothetical protein